jgi:hypothetical protein
MLTKFGSHLYGTDTPESDTDYKGIYMPEPMEICLGNIPKSINLNTNNSHDKNSSEDVDVEIYSLHHFIHLACKGETVALDMLHTNDECLVTSSRIWRQLVNNKHHFYTKNLKAFVGYARKQAAKYGVKGSRLDAAKEFIEFCDHWIKEYTVATKTCCGRLKSIWHLLPINEHSRVIGKNPNGLKQYQICGKTLQESQNLVYVRDIMQKFLDQYGARAKLASENKGIDWKAMSHAIRAALQVRSILENRRLSFPLPEAKQLREVKQGLVPFALVLSWLEDLMEEVESLTERSTLPPVVNSGYWKGWLYLTTLECIQNAEVDI